MPFIQSCGPSCTEFREKTGPRLRDPVSWLPLAVMTSSRNLGPILSWSSVVGRLFALSHSLVAMASRCQHTSLCSVPRKEGDYELLMLAASATASMGELATHG